MKYSSQTGNVIGLSRPEKTTAPQGDVDRGIIYNISPGFNVVDQTKLSIKLLDGIVKEELTKEEEDRFYKKAFKTSLL